MDGKCDLKPQFAGDGLHDTCGLDLGSLVSQKRDSIAMELTIPYGGNGDWTQGTATKICDDTNICLFVTADHVLGPDRSSVQLNMHDSDREFQVAKVLKRDPVNDIATLFFDSQKAPSVEHPGIRYQPNTGKMEAGQLATWVGFAVQNPHDLTVSIGVVKPEEKIGFLTKLQIYLSGESYPPDYTCVQGRGFNGQSGSLLFNDSGEYKGLYSFSLRPLLFGQEHACYVNIEPLNKLLKESFDLLKTQRDLDMAMRH